MAKGKRESIVPGLGKKQAAVLNNEAGRQAEHKRHLDELGFPEYVEPDFVRHAPVSYDDPSNPSPSRVVNQAGQDLGATNDPLLSKSLAEMIDVQAIVKEAASEVIVSKATKTSKLDGSLPEPQVGFGPIGTVKKLALGLVAVGAASSIPWLLRVIDQHRYEGFFKDDFKTSWKKVKDLSVDKPYSARSFEDQKRLKYHLDNAYKQMFGKKKDGTFKYASERDLIEYFQFLYANPDGTLAQEIPKSDLRVFLNDYSEPDPEEKAKEGPYGQKLRTFKDDTNSFFDRKFGTQQITGSVINADMWEKYKATAGNTILNQGQADEILAGIATGSLSLSSIGVDAQGNITDPKKATDILTRGAEALDEAAGLVLDAGIDKGKEIFGTASEETKAWYTQFKGGLPTDEAGVPIEGYKPTLTERAGELKENVDYDIDNLKTDGVAGFESTKTDLETRYDANKENLKTYIDEFKDTIPQNTLDKLNSLKNDMEDPGGAGLAPPPTPTPAPTPAPTPTPTPTPTGRNIQTDLQTDPGKQPLGRTQAELDVIARNKAAKDQALKTRDPKALERFGMAPVGTKAIHKYNAWLQKAEEEGAMAKVQLDRVSDLADMLHDILEDEDELPGWIQNKISDSLHNLEASFTNLAYDEKEELGLRKTMDTFKDFLAQAPSQGGFLKKDEDTPETALGLIAQQAVEFIFNRGPLFELGRFLYGKFEEDAIKALTPELAAPQMRKEIAYQTVGGQKFYDELPKSRQQEILNSIDTNLVNSLSEYAVLYGQKSEKVKDFDLSQIQQDLGKLNLKLEGGNIVSTAPQGMSYQAPDRSSKDDPDMSVPDFVQPTSTIKPVGVREALASEVAARNKTDDPFVLPPVEGGEEKMAGNLDKFVTALTSNLNIASDLQRAASLKNVKPLPKVASGVGYMKDGKSYDEFGRRTTAPVESALREITIVDDKGKKGTSVVSDAQIIPGSYDPAVVRDVFGGSKSAANSYFGIQAAIIKELVNDFIQKAKKKKGGRKKDPRLARAGVAGFNKPKRTPKHPTKSHIVVAKEGDKIKTIRYGQQGAKTAGDPKKGESAKMKKKRKSFKARHRKNIKRGKMSAAYWADKSKW